MGSYGILVQPRPGTPYQGHQFVELLGGLNNSVSDELVHLNELTDVQNWTPDPENAGVLFVREGLSQISTQQAAAFIGQVHDGIYDIYAAIPTKIINDAGTAVDTGLTSSTDCDFESFAGYDIFVNGTEFRKTNDGSTWSGVGGSPPAAKYIQVYNRFLFAAGHDAAKLRWSGISDAEDWDATNEINLSPDANDDIMGLCRYRGSLFVFCERSFYQVRGFGEKSIQIIDRSEPGTTSHRSLIPTPYGLFWWSEDGIYWTFDGVSTYNISELRIPKTISNLNANKFSLVHGVWNKARQRVEFYAMDGSNTTHDTAIYYYPRVGVRQIEGVNVGSFWIGKGLGVQQAASGTVLVSGERRVYLGAASSTGYLYHQTGNDDDGTAINAYFETKRDPSEHGPITLKRFKTLAPMFELTGDVDVEYGLYLNNSISVNKSWSLSLSSAEGFTLDTDLLGVGKLGSGVEAIEKSIGWSEKWRKAKHRISTESASRLKVRGIRTEGYLVAI